MKIKENDPAQSKLINGETCGLPYNSVTLSIPSEGYLTTQ